MLFDVRRIFSRLNWGAAMESMQALVVEAIDHVEGVRVPVQTKAELSGDLPPDGLPLQTRNPVWFEQSP